jgi:hypothetical protein
MKVLFALPAFALASGPALARAQGEGDLNSGGLAPPPAIESEAPQTGPTVTEQELQRADREDSGRGLSFFWVNGEVGYGLLGLQTFHANDLVDAELVESTQNGLVFGAGAGVRLIFLTLGARFRLGTFDKWQLWTLNAELGFRLPFGRLEPYFTFGGGYASLGSFDTGSVGGALDDIGVSSDGLDVRGFDLRGGVGIDYFVGRTLSVGANLSGDLLFLSRPRVSGVEASGSGADTEAEAAADVYSKDGSSVGGAATLMAVVGLHF